MLVVPHVRYLRGARNPTKQSNRKFSRRSGSWIYTCVLVPIRRKETAFQALNRSNKSTLALLSRAGQARATSLWLHGLTTVNLQTSYQNPPPGYIFLPVGTPDLAERCKELSRQRGLPVSVVNVSPATQRGEATGLASQTHRTAHSTGHRSNDS